MPKFTLIYSLTIVRVIEADDEIEADEEAWDNVPYPDITADIEKAECDQIIINEVPE